MVKNMPANAGDMHSVCGWERSPGGGNGNPLQYSFLENPMDRGAWQATVNGVAELDMTERTHETQCTVVLFFKKLINCSLFLAALGLHCCTRTFSSCGAWTSHCGGFFC